MVSLPEPPIIVTFVASLFLTRSLPSPAFIEELEPLLKTLSSPAPASITTSDAVVLFDELPLKMVSLPSPLLIVTESPPVAISPPPLTMESLPSVPVNVTLLSLLEVVSTRLPSILTEDKLAAPTNEIIPSPTVTITSEPTVSFE